jgi:hypothetical protein
MLGLVTISGSFSQENLYLVNKDKTLRLQVVTRLLVGKRSGLWRSVPKNILSI